MLIHNDHFLLIDKTPPNVVHPTGKYEVFQRNVKISFVDMIRKFGNPNHEKGWQFIVLFRTYAVGGKIFIFGEDKQILITNTWKLRILTSVFTAPSVGWDEELVKAVDRLFNGNMRISNG